MMIKSLYLTHSGGYVKIFREKLVFNYFLDEEIMVVRQRKATYICGKFSKYWSLASINIWSESWMSW